MFLSREVVGGPDGRREDGELADETNRERQVPAEVDVVADGDEG